MSTNYSRATVRQRIPAAWLAPIERWLLSRIFKTEERGDFLVFRACWDEGMLTYEVSPDAKLREALTASRELCPERCAEVERALNKSNEFQGVIHYERIFQSIVRRHPDVLRHVSIEYLELNTNRGLDGEILTIIIAQSIMSISSDGRIDQQPWNPHVRCIDPSFHHRDEADNNREG
jgi:hypothetical protein